MPDPTTPTGAVFLSYSREDSDVARRLADALRAFGMEVWFDQNELRGGDAWDAKIRTQIRTCKLFVAVISSATQARGEGYFRREWKIAVERTHDMASGVPFLVPVVIDGTPESESLVPDEFMRVQWTRLPQGVPTPQFVEQVRRLLEGRSTAAKGSRPATAEPAGQPAGATRKKGVPAWTWGGLTAIVVAIVTAVSVSNRNQSHPPAPPIPAATATNPSPVAAATTDKSIAVLPFANMSEEKDSAFFTDGMQEDILTNLALVRELRVVSRTSVMQYRNTTKSIRQIAQELGVAYILEGSVRRAGNKVRVTGQLIHAATDEHVWAKAYDRDLTDVFSIQSELSQAIATALSAALSPQEKSLLERRPTDNLAAYDLYTKGRELRLSSPNGQGESIPLFEQAVSLDPNFAGAWAQLGSAHAQQYFNEADHSDDRLARAKRAIDAAVRLAPNDPEVIEMLGDYYYYGYRDYTQASQQYQRLAVLRPNDAAVFGSLGFIHRRQARWGEALAELRRACALEPRNMRYARTLFQLAEGLNLYDEALQVQKQVVALHPESGFDRGQLALVPFVASGSTQEARALMAQLDSAAKSDPVNVYDAKLLSRGIGDWEAALKFDRQLRYYDGFEEPHWQQDVTAAMVLWINGDRDAARTMTESAIPAGRAEVQQKPSATSLALLSIALVLTGKNEEGLRCAEASRDLIPEAKDAVTGPQGSLNYAQVLAWTGDKDRALAELARLLRTPFGENIYIARVSPGWWPLHGDPRFEALLADPKNNAPLF